MEWTEWKIYQSAIDKNENYNRGLRNKYHLNNNLSCEEINTIIENDNAGC